MTAAMPDPFESPWLKWAQAVVNAEVLQDNINELGKLGNLHIQLGMTQDYDPGRHCIIITAGPEDVPPIFPARWGLLLGDIVHNYRASLDHLAWALYKRGTTPNLSASQERGVYFPIASDREQFNGWLKGKRPKLPGVRRSDVAIVRRYQPYQTVARHRNRHVFKVLDDLANADKHRVIQPIEAVPEHARFEVVGLADCRITRWQPRRQAIPLKPGTELARIYVKKTGPDPFIDVTPHFALDPAVAGSFTFQEWGYGTMRLIAQLLSEFAKPPEDVRALLSVTGHGEAPPWLSR
jgi:hypothetical protein